LICENDIRIIYDRTGSGKTTQIPQFLYEAGYGIKCMSGRIVIIEPRRVIAVNMAKPVSCEFG
jgi:ATP-dependent RNA helicase DHX37/DHR1